MHYKPNEKHKGMPVALKVCIGIAVVVVILFALSSWRSYDGPRPSAEEPTAEEQEAKEEYVAMPWDLLGVEVVMSSMCEDDLDLWERLILLGEDDGIWGDEDVGNWTVEEWAQAIVITEHMCSTWRTEGNAGMAKYMYGDADFSQTVDREALRERVGEVEAQLEAWGDLDTLRTFMRIR